MSTVATEVYSWPVGAYWVGYEMAGSEYFVSRHEDLSTYEAVFGNRRDAEGWAHRLTRGLREGLASKLAACNDLTTLETIAQLLEV